MGFFFPGYRGSRSDDGDGDAPAQQYPIRAAWASTKAMLGLALINAAAATSTGKIILTPEPNPPPADPDNAVQFLGVWRADVDGGEPEGFLFDGTHEPFDAAVAMAINGVGGQLSVISTAIAPYSHYAITLVDTD